MRNVVAGSAAALVLVLVAVGAWSLLAPRLSDDGPATPSEVTSAFVAAWSAGDEAALDDLLWSGADAFADARVALAAAVGDATTTVEVIAVSEDATARASADLTVAVRGGALPDSVAWTTSASLERRRGRWGVVASAATLHPELHDGWGFALEPGEDTRAPILDHTGVPLTGAGTVHVVGIAPGQVRDPERLRLTRASTLPESLDELIALLERTDTNPNWFYPVVTIDQARFDDVWRRLRAVPGVIQREDTGNVRADSGFARHVLGRVGLPTAEMIADRGLDPDVEVGLYGLERLYEDTLTGAAPVTLVVVEADGDVHVDVATVGSDAPTPVTVTLDATVQQAIENALAGVSDDAAVVAVDVATGAIRGTASRPLGGYNRAWEGRYPPGDAFVPVTGIAALAAGVGHDDAIDCPSEAIVSGARLNAPRALGETTVAVALGGGCDPSVGALAADLDDDALGVAAATVGFDLAYDLPLPVATATFPAPRDTTERVRAATGQAQVLATPLHLASVAAAIDGTWDAPHLLPDADAASRTLPAGAAPWLTALFDAGVASTGSAAGLGGTNASAIAGTGVHATGGSTSEHGWVLGVTDGVAFCVLVEDAAAPGPALRIAESFVRELAALR